MGQLNLNWVQQITFGCAHTIFGGTKNNIYFKLIETITWSIKIDNVVDSTAELRNNNYNHNFYNDIQKIQIY